MLEYICIGYICVIWLLEVHRWYSERKPCYMKPKNFLLMYDEGDGFLDKDLTGQFENRHLYCDPERFLVEDEY